MANGFRINGASLVPDASSSLNVLLQGFGTKQQRDKERANREKEEARARQSQEALRVLTGRPPSP